MATEATKRPANTAEPAEPSTSTTEPAATTSPTKSPVSKKSKKETKSSGTTEEQKRGTKKRSHKNRPNDEGDAPRPTRQDHFGLLSTMNLNIMPFVKDVPLVFVNVDTLLMNPFFDTMYAFIVNGVFPTANIRPDNLITLEQFRNVCRYLTKMRIDAVYSACSGRRSANRIPISRDLLMPKALADMINGIGRCLIFGSTTYVVPEPENEGQDPAERLMNIVTHAMLTAFNTLVQRAHAKGLINLATLTGQPDGTAWWLLSTRQSANTTQLANDSQTIINLAVFDEWTPADSMIAAVIQRQFDGAIDGRELMITASDPIADALRIRSQFINTA